MAGKNALQSVNLPSLNVIFWNRLPEIKLRKFAEYYRRLYGGSGVSLCPPLPPSPYKKYL